MLRRQFGHGRSPPRRLLEVDDLVGGGVGVQREDRLGRVGTGRGGDVVVTTGPYVTRVRLLRPETPAVRLAQLRSRVGVNWTGIYRIPRTGLRSRGGIRILAIIFSFTFCSKLDPQIPN